MSPDALQSHSLPSSVSDALEAMVGGGLDDLTLEDIDPSALAEDQQQSEVLEKLEHTAALRLLVNRTPCGVVAPSH